MSMETYYKNYLSHHGIFGQRWGKRNGPPYPIAPGDHSASEKKAGWKKSIDDSKADEDNKSGFRLSDKYKKYLKVGATIAAGCLVAYGSYKLATNPMVHSYMGIGLKELQKQTSTRKFVNNAQETVKMHGGINDSVKNFVSDNGTKINPEPLKHPDNCKEVADATLKVKLGIDKNATAGDASEGTVFDFVDKNYNKNGITKIGGDAGISPDPTGDSTNRVKKAILKKCNEGDVGMIGITWNENKVDPDYLKKKRTELNNPDWLPGHAYNFEVKDGKVVFEDNQNQKSNSKVDKYLRSIAPNREIQVCKVTKEAFEKD